MHTVGEPIYINKGSIIYSNFNGKYDFRVENKVSGEIYQLIGFNVLVSN